VSNTTWAGLALPLDLGVVGMTGCTLYTSIDITVTVPMVGSTAQLTLAIPNQPNLIAATVNAQGFAVDPGINRLNAVTSNGLHLVLGL